MAGGLTNGWAERDTDVVYNAATAIDATGSQLAHYRKIQLFGTMENNAFLITGCNNQAHDKTFSPPLYFLKRL